MSSIPLYSVIPTLLHANQSSAVLTTAAVAAAMSGGIYSVLPTYVAEQYGLYRSAGIYGMLMLYGSIGTLIGIVDKIVRDLCSDVTQVHTS